MLCRVLPKLKTKAERVGVVWAEFMTTSNIWDATSKCRGATLLKGPGENTALVDLMCFYYCLLFRISYLEIYNEVIFDLLSTLPGDRTTALTTPTAHVSSGSGSGLGVSEDERGVVTVKELSLRLATNEEDALNMLFEVSSIQDCS